ncbi:hypothetical protein [Verrucosispora sp. NA02020]|uniref:hypothetical protein n=1 Tax=Verrucosispora sp. NA02020 TaxID=2742132 RepID=UPI003D72335B
MSRLATPSPPILHRAASAAPRTDAGPRRHQRALSWTGLLVALAVPVGMVAGQPLRALAALGLACLGPGAALVGLRRVRQPLAGWALALLVSVCGWTATATLAAWTGRWYPSALALAGAAVVGIVSLVGLVRAGRRPARPWRAGFRLATAPGVRAATHPAVLAAAVALWLVALAGTDVTRVGQYGLLATVHPAFFGALALCVAGFAVGLLGPGRRVPSRSLPGYLVLLVLLLHGTTPLLLDQPQYAWTFKHLGVVEFIQTSGGVGASGDIYQQWPALFAATAQLADVSGVGVAALADWSAVFFNLAGALVLLAVAGTLHADRRVGYLTVFGFLCINWIEEDYLSPQALAFLLSLGALLVVLRWLRRPVPDRPAAAPGERPGTATAGGRVRVTAIAGLLGVFAVLTAGHQLSPYLLLAQITALVLLRQVRPGWLPLPLAAMLLAYLAPRYGMVSGSFSIFDGLNLFANASGNADGWGSDGQAFSAIVVRVLALAVWTGAALAAWYGWRRSHPVTVPAVLAAAPFLLLAAQNYGGEAIYRVFLFSAPWCAYLIAAALLAPRDHAGRPGSARAGRVPVAAAAVLAAVLGVAALATMQGRHGQLMVDRQSTAEVRAARHLYATAAPGSTIATVSSNFPGRLSADYGEFNRSVAVGEPDLVEGAGLRHALLGPEHVPQIEEYLRGFAGTETYLVVSDGMRRQVAYFGHLPDGAVDRLAQALDAAPGWSVAHRDDGVVVYRLTG